MLAEATLSIPEPMVIASCTQVIVNTSTSSLEVVEIHSYVRGYHAYMDVWENPEQGQGMLLKREPGNSMPLLYSEKGRSLDMCPITWRLQFPIS